MLGVKISQNFGSSSWRSRVLTLESKVVDLSVAIHLLYGVVCSAAHSSL